MLFFKEKRTFLILAILFLFGSHLHGQAPNIIQGKVTDAQKRPVRGATVELVGHDQRTTTDKSGIFRLAVPDGTYTLHISRMGYEDKTAQDKFGKYLFPEFLLEEKTVGLNEVVVTATRTEKNVKDIPLPVTIIDKKEMQQKVMVRLNEVLAEQPGIILTEDHGTGIQLQGFEAKYTLILIDGEPIIGRSSGTLELSRITMANVERVEILKGPSSSLYGSEAMAGVVNIITKKPPKGKQLGTSIRYGTNNALDLSLDGSIARQRTSVYGAFNRFSNSGYNYARDNSSSTVPPFYGYTGNVKVDYKVTPKLELKIGLKYNDEHAKDDYMTNTGMEDQDVFSRFLRRDIVITPRAVYHHSDKHTTFLRLNQSFYKTDTKINIIEDGNQYNHDYFDQNFSRAELQHNIKINEKTVLTAGGGGTDEWLKAARYEDKKEFIAGFAYVQADVRVSEHLNFIAGGRFDTHNVYASQFSPKLAAQYKTRSWLTVHGTIGSGFKAPDFRELYLNWTNPSQGYSVFGAEDAAYKLNKLMEMGEITEILYDPTKIQALEAERSWNYQAGFKLHPGAGFDGSVSLFRNNVTNLIETFVIATKTNGKSVYTYSNQKNVLIQGSEAHAGYQSQNLHIKTGIQFLFTANRDVLNAIKEGRGYYTRDSETGSSRLVKKSEYGGLLNRSRYTTNTSLTYHWAKHILDITFRWAYRNRFGVRDLDGNGILNLNEEYAPGYSIFNASAVKSFFNKRLSLSLSAENLRNIKHTGLATMPGRMIFIGASYRTK